MAHQRSVAWPVLKRYDQDHLARIALPLGGIGTGTVSLGGRGDLRDWEIMNRPAKGFKPGQFQPGMTPPVFVLVTKQGRGPAVARAIEGPLELLDYEGGRGSEEANHGLPRFKHCSFAAAYPLGQVMLSDPGVPLRVRIEAFNPMVPGDAEISGLPVAVLRFVLTNTTGSAVKATVCGSVPNFIGIDGSQTATVWGGATPAVGAKANRNVFRDGPKVRGVFMDSSGVDPGHEAWGTIALTTTEPRSAVSYRTAWAKLSWGDSLLDFWDDLTSDGKIDDRDAEGVDNPTASLAATVTVPARGEKAVTFVLSWHFPNRQQWEPRGEPPTSERVGNWYTTRYADAWDAAEKIVPRLGELEERTVQFVRTFCDSDLPEVVKEAALFNLSTLRSQTCFRTQDGRFFGWEGCHDHSGSCLGSCTHVWNYEQATAHLFGELARSMREVEFGHATDERGLMSFRVMLPLRSAREFVHAAADGQMGCLMKLHRDWQLSGDEKMLRTLWPHAKRALEFCWIKGGWDADRDGVMEGCQHNTMDVEYYGPNAQMTGWYLGALRAAEEMARHLGDAVFAAECRRLFESGSAWMDKHLFNGEYYEQIVKPPASVGDIAPGLTVGMGSEDLKDPDLQLGAACLIDQLVGQYFAHVSGLGYLHAPGKVKKTLASIVKYNFKRGFHDHFNHLRSFVLGDESATLMATYPRGRRPRRPFPYYNEVMTGFEYTAAVGLLYERETSKGLELIEAIRERYDGQKRSPFNEAECGHHYARAMASWAVVLALTGFHYSAVSGAMTFAPAAKKKATWFWSTGNAWGTVEQRPGKKGTDVILAVQHGRLALRSVTIRGVGTAVFDETRVLSARAKPSTATSSGVQPPGQTGAFYFPQAPHLPHAAR